jgi:hypothetical protein
VFASWPCANEVRVGQTPSEALWRHESSEVIAQFLVLPTKKKWRLALVAGPSVYLLEKLNKCCSIGAFLMLSDLFSRAMIGNFVTPFLLIIITI